MKQKIVCIGWGSLIWKPGNLKIESKWFEDGPNLPIEFTRISSDNRVTLIIDKEAELQKTLWAIMSCNELNDAIISLKERESITKCSLISFFNKSDKATNFIEEEVKNWLIEKSIDTAIWTGLSFSKKTNNLRPSFHYILNHLKNINNTERELAEEYIRKAPRQIMTKYRELIQSHFGWIPY